MLVAREALRICGGKPRLPAAESPTPSRATNLAPKAVPPIFPECNQVVPGDFYLRNF